MDGAKLSTETKASNRWVGGRAIWLEAWSRDHVDRIAVKILVLVTSYNGENPLRRKHKVFLAMIVSWELADPK
jgi:hypothetical protein